MKMIRSLLDHQPIVNFAHEVYALDVKNPQWRCNRDRQSERILGSEAAQQTQVGLKILGWVVPPPSKIHHQDYYIFSRESL